MTALLVVEKPLLERLQFFFSKSEDILQSYYEMRAKAFASVWNLKHSSAEEDALDRQSDILVVQDAGVCVAGARLTICPPFSNVKLSFEVEGFNVCNMLEKRGLHGKCYGEISRFAISDGYRDVEVCREVLRIMADSGKKYGCECFIVVSPHKTARFFKRVYASLGYSSVIHAEIDVPARPTYEGIKMCVMVIDL